MLEEVYAVCQKYGIDEGRAPEFIRIFHEAPRYSRTRLQTYRSPGPKPNFEYEYVVVSLMFLWFLATGSKPTLDSGQTTGKTTVFMEFVVDCFECFGVIDWAGPIVEDDDGRRRPALNSACVRVRDLYQPESSDAFIVAEYRKTRPATESYSDFVEWFERKQSSKKPFFRVAAKETSWHKSAGIVTKPARRKEEEILFIAGRISPVRFRELS